MKDFINRWMTRNAKSPELLACGLRHPDETTFNQTLDSEFSEASLNTSWDCIAEAFSFLRQQRLDATQLCWSFEKHRIYAAIRGDQTCLGLITKAGTSGADLTTIEKMLVDFRSLRCSSPKQIRA